MHSLGLALLPGPGQGVPRPLHIPNPKCPCLFLSVCSIWSSSPGIQSSSSQKPSTSFPWYSGDKWVTSLLGTCSAYLPVVHRHAVDSCSHPGIHPSQSESQLTFPGSQNLPLVPSYLCVPLEDDQQALYKPGLFGGSTYLFHSSSTPCFDIVRPQKRFKSVRRQTSRNVENF